MKIVECRVIRPKDRTSAVLATAELLFDNGVRLVNMHLMRPRDGQTENRLRMPSITTNTGTTLNAFNPNNQEMRTAMQKAVEETLAEAVKARTNDFTKVFAVLKQSRTPEFSTLRLHKFPENNIPVKAMASVTIDDTIRLNRIAIIKNPDTGMYVVQFPKFSLQGGRLTLRYFRFSTEAYDALYKLVLDEYMRPPEEEETETEQETA